MTRLRVYQTWLHERSRREGGSDSRSRPGDGRQRPRFTKGVCNKGGFQGQGAMDTTELQSPLWKTSCWKPRQREQGSVAVSGHSLPLNFWVENGVCNKGACDCVASVEPSLLKPPLLQTPFVNHECMDMWNLNGLHYTACPHYTKTLLYCLHEQLPYPISGSFAL